MKALLTRFRYSLLWLCRTLAPPENPELLPFGADHDPDRINIHLLALTFWFLFLGLIGLGF